MKQGCVLTPTLFSIYLAAMLEVAFKGTGVYNQTRKEADLFNVAQFKAKSKTSIKIVREMLYADDSALVAHSAEDMQSLVEKFARAASQFSLQTTSGRQSVFINHQSSNYQQRYQKRSAFIWYRVTSQVQDFQVPREYCFREC